MRLMELDWLSVWTHHIIGPAAVSVTCIPLVYDTVVVRGRDTFIKSKGTSQHQFFGMLFFKSSAPTFDQLSPRVLWGSSKHHHTGPLYILSMTAPWVHWARPLRCIRPYKNQVQVPCCYCLEEKCVRTLLTGKPSFPLGLVTVTLSLGFSDRYEL